MGIQDRKTRDGAKGRTGMKEEIYDCILKTLAELIHDTKFMNHVFAVGGCVRDKRLGIEIKDIDLVVDLPNGGIELAKYLESNGYTKGSIVIYENYGTVMFKLKNFPEIELEAVQTRKEDYHDAKTRNPVTSFGTIEEDCHRRDFTINALYYNISEGKEYDFNGNSIRDLQKEVIDTCGDPDIIFCEDPLRILRAVRFASKLGYIISARTEDGIRRNKSRLEIISQERITDEFNKILKSPRPELGIERLYSLGLMPYVLPEFTLNSGESLNYIVNNFHNIMVKAVENNQSQFYMLLIYLSVHIDQDVFKEAMKRMKYSCDDIDRVYKCAILYPRLFSVDLMFDKTLLHEVEYCIKNPEDYALIYYLIQALYHRASPASWDEMHPDKDHPMFGYTLPVNGDDIMSILGIEPGPRIKKILNDLLNEAFKNPRISREECIKLIKTKFSVDD